MDDLGAIVIIAVVYTATIARVASAGAFAVWIVLLAMNRLCRVTSLTPYLVGGIVMWFLMLQSGVHATIAGVMLAFAVPFSSKEGPSPSHRLEHALHRPVAFLILPVFALANAGILFGADWLQSLASANSMGIAAGLILGKPLGVMLLCWMATVLGFCRLPPDLTWPHLLGAGFLGGIGFTMSIFITDLAFDANAQLVNASKMAIVAASVAAGTLGFTWLRFCRRPAPH